MKWLVISLALIEAGWMAYDGTRALYLGDYVTPKTGRHAGQLGPWAKVVSGAGIEPRSTLMKSFFAAYGVLWLIIIGFFVFNVSWAHWAMLIAAVGALWYLPFGTLLGAIQIVLLLLNHTA